MTNFPMQVLKQFLINLAWVLGFITFVVVSSLVLAYSCAPSDSLHAQNVPRQGVVSPYAPQSAIRSRPRPVSRRCTPSPEQTAIANRWSKTEGYEYMQGRGDLVCRWLEENSKNPIDPAIWLWNRGYNAPALTCTDEYEITRDELHKDWRFIILSVKSFSKIIPVNMVEKQTIIVQHPCYRSGIKLEWFETTTKEVDVK